MCFQTVRILGGGAIARGEQLLVGSNSKWERVHERGQSGVLLLQREGCSWQKEVARQGWGSSVHWKSAENFLRSGSWIWD